MTAAHNLPYKFWTRRPSARSAPVLTEHSSRSLAGVALSAQHFLTSELFERHCFAAREDVYRTRRRRGCMPYVSTQERLGQGK